MGTCNGILKLKLNKVEFLLCWIQLGAKFVFSIYDFEGNGTVDAADLGSCLRALNLVPTEKIVEKLGGVKKKG